MLTKIYKYRLPVTDVQDLVLPARASVLHVGCQGRDDEVVLWVRVPSDPRLTQQQRDTWTFRIVGTGQEFDDAGGWWYVDTTQTPSGLVWHVFAVMNQPDED